MFVLPGMWTNQAELAEVNSCSATTSNDKDANNFYIVWFTHVPYTIKENV